MPQLKVIGEFFQSLQRKVEAVGLFDYLTKKFPQEMREMRRFEPVLKQIKAPVLVLTTDKDFVSNYRKYLPEEEIEKRTAEPISEEQLRQQLIESNKWENLPEEEKQKFGSKEKFMEYYMARYRTREKIAATGRARREYVKKIVPQAGPVEVIIASRFGSHIGLPVERYKQTAYVISRIFDRMRRQKPH